MQPISLQHIRELQADADLYPLQRAKRKTAEYEGDGSSSSSSSSIINSDNNRYTYYSYNNNNSNNSQGKNELEYTSVANIPKSASTTPSPNPSPNISTAAVASFIDHMGPDKKPRKDISQILPSGVDGGVDLFDDSLMNIRTANDEPTGVRRKKAGRKPSLTEPINKRAAQNRAAQRAFRERREQYIRDLEMTVQALQSDKTNPVTTASDSSSSSIPASGAENVCTTITSSSTAPEKDILDENTRLRQRVSLLENENAALREMRSFGIAPTTNTGTNNSSQFLNVNNTNSSVMSPMNSVSSVPYDSPPSISAFNALLFPDTTISTPSMPSVAIPIIPAPHIYHMAPQISSFPLPTMDITTSSSGNIAAAEFDDLFSIFDRTTAKMEETDISFDFQNSPSLPSFRPLPNSFKLLSHSQTSSPTPAPSPVIPEQQQSLYVGASEVEPSFNMINAFLMGDMFNSSTSVSDPLSFLTVSPPISKQQQEVQQQQQNHDGHTATTSNSSALHPNTSSTPLSLMGDMFGSLSDPLSLLTMSSSSSEQLEQNQQQQHKSHTTTVDSLAFSPTGTAASSLTTLKSKVAMQKANAPVEDALVIDELCSIFMTKHRCSDLRRIQDEIVHACERGDQGAVKTLIQDLKEKKKWWTED